jgi:hypothetical protein
VLILSLLSTGAASQADFFVSVDFLPDAVWINLVLRRVMHLLLAFFGCFWHSLSDPISLSLIDQCAVASQT